MTKEQRTRLEGLIDNYVEVNMEAAQHFGTDKGGMAMNARTKARDELKDCLAEIEEGA